MRPLLEATARLLHRLTALAFPQPFAKGDVYALIAEVQTFLKNSSDEALHCRNQALVVFSPAFPTAQFRHAWTVTRELYRQRHGVELDTVYTVNLKEQQQVARVFRGRRRQKATREVRIHSADIPTIIFHSLQLQFFTVAERGFVQTPGSPMGSPLSPALCNMVISAHEEVWRRTFSQSFSAMNRNLLCLRYVDNRLWISEDTVASLPGVRLFLSNHFYGGDIILEDEPAYDFVGFSLDIPARTIRYNRSCHFKDLPSPLSASLQSILLSGLLARAHAIRQFAYPASQVHADLCYLWSLASERKLPTILLFPEILEHATLHLAAQKPCYMLAFAVTSDALNT